MRRRQVLYDQGLIEPLAKTLHGLCKSAPGCRVLLALSHQSGPC